MIFQHISRCYEEQKVTCARSLFVLTWRGAGRGSDRFYAWLDALSHLKRKGLCWFFNLYLYRKSFLVI
ncbi:hypothetical protein CON65_24255 [Bacillus pseudomycoides]|uniref:Uncharacterized protein n=1 Tax=Bacillus pseudomycoides TaxID=64104 RepID=A0AA91ZR57_9BACI|nr:hypothetical protein COO03_02175 [Bacillus sp. AFS098217]PED80142.1 hypothetical protein CON65_24255 [Bacillus pseudomycoides]PEU10416.1 hypothetical protein CN524_16375 [Bacillus sp. AFS019443]PEU18609.1 hypothetical protein CN525_10680 [Bacillus sp. AFS014408]